MNKVNVVKKAEFKNYDTEDFVIGNPKLWIEKYGNMSQVRWIQDGVRDEYVFISLVERTDLIPALKFVFYTYNKGSKKAELSPGYSGYAYVNHESAEIIYNLIFYAFDSTLAYMKKLSKKGPYGKLKNIMYPAYERIIAENDPDDGTGSFNIFNIRRDLL